MNQYLRRFDGQKAALVEECAAIYIYGYSWSYGFSGPDSIAFQGKSVKAYGYP